MRKVASLTHNSSNYPSAFLKICSLQDMQPQIFMQIFHFTTQIIKKIYSQKLRFNKINTFYCFIEDILKLNCPFFFFFNGKCVTVKIK